jgi:hypothetical protein
MVRPTGVTVLAVLCFIGACFFVLLGIGSIVGGGFVGAMLAGSGSSGMGGAAMAGIGVIVGVFFLVFAGLYGVTGWGLLNLKDWARIVSMVLAALGVLGALFALIGMHIFTALIRLAISGWILWYLNQPHVVAAFQSRPPAIPAATA